MFRPHLGKLLFLSVLTSACGGSSASDAEFEPAKRPADVCALLTVADVETIVPDPGPPDRPAASDTADIWELVCTYHSLSAPDASALSLHVRGALTEKGAWDLKNDVALQGSWGTANITSIAGLGDEATYGVDSSTNFAAVVALSGKHTVELGAIGDPIPTREVLVPLVSKALTGIVSLQ